MSLRRNVVKPFRVGDIMDYFFAGNEQPQSDQPDDWAGGDTVL